MITAFVSHNMKPIIFTAIALFSMATAQAQTAYRCPDRVTQHGKTHRFENASVSEGKHELGYILRPEQNNPQRWIWSSTAKRPNFYLQCQYHHGKITREIRVKGAKQCVLHKPLQRGSYAVCF